MLFNNECRVAQDPDRGPRLVMGGAQADLSRDRSQTFEVITGST
jgi:hypothetical protein